MTELKEIHEAIKEVELSKTTYSIDLSDGVRLEYATLQQMAELKAAGVLKLNEEGIIGFGEPKDISEITAAKLVRKYQYDEFYYKKRFKFLWSQLCDDITRSDIEEQLAEDFHGYIDYCSILKKHRSAVSSFISAAMKIGAKYIIVRRI
jgi:hypothetical protein